MKKLAILGSTGSIGTSTLSICESFPDRYHPIALAAGQNLEAAFEQAVRWRPQVISIATEQLANALQQRLKAAGVTGVEVVHGTAGTVRVATLPAVDFVVSAIVMAPQLKPRRKKFKSPWPVAASSKTSPSKVAFAALSTNALKRCEAGSRASKKNA